MKTKIIFALLALAACSERPQAKKSPQPRANSGEQKSPVANELAPKSGGASELAPVSTGSTSVVVIDLAGKTFSRTGHSDGMFGQPAGERKHSIRFGKDGSVVDDGATFFGNPPESGTYKIEGSKVTLSLKDFARRTYEEIYNLSADGKTLSQGVQILTLETKPDLAGKKFRRTVTSDGMFGQPAGERKHSIVFVDASKVTDDGATFFGNPPQSGTYEIEGDIVTIKLRSITGAEEVEKFNLSADSKTLTSLENGRLVLNAE